MAAVLVTRPQVASEGLELELRRHGYETVVEPLLTIMPAAAPPPEINTVQAVMITSANLFEVLDSHRAQVFLALPCFCVGLHTAERARAFGFRQVRNTTGGGIELARLIGAELADKEKTILHIGAQDVDSKAQDELKRMGFSLSLWTVYKAAVAMRFTEQAIRRLETGGLDAVLIFSARTAVTLKTLLAQHGLEACCERLIAIGLSEAVCEALQPLPWRVLAAAAVPTEDAVIARLKEIAPP